MARPLRLEYPGALYHVTARGDRREDIYLHDRDRSGFLALLGEVCERFNWRIPAYCLMSNHYHLLVETPDDNLSKGMRQLNGVYTQRFNRRHGRVGHVFQGRYQALLVQKAGYLLELSRYIVLNPVRARMVRTAREWRWSSYRATIGQANAPAWLQTDELLAQFSKQRARAARAYAQFVREGIAQPSPWQALRHQLFLGDERFIAQLKKRKRPKDLHEIPKTQRRSLGKSLAQYQRAYSERDAAMAQAYASGLYTMRAIGEFFGVHYMTVSRAVRKFEVRPKR